MKQFIKWTMPMVLIGAVALAQNVTADEAQSTVNTFKQRDPDLADLFTSSVGYVVFPQVKKGAFVFGGAGSEGILFERGVAMGTVKMSQVTVGAQVGGQTYSELIFSELYWPDFRRQNLFDAVAEYQRRERRYGGLEQ